MVQVQRMMSELFELAPDRVQPEARLVEDLELDSLDAFDLAIKVEEITGVAIEESKLRELLTVENVVVALEAIARTHGLASFATPASGSPQNKS